MLKSVSAQTKIALGSVLSAIGALAIVLSLLPALACQTDPFFGPRAGII